MIWNFAKDKNDLMKLSKVGGWIMLFEKCNNVSEEFIESKIKLFSKFESRKVWYWISRRHALSHWFLLRHKDEVRWDVISEYQELSDRSIEKFADRLDWAAISSCQKISPKIMEKYKDKIIPIAVKHNKKMT